MSAYIHTYIYIYQIDPREAVPEVSKGKGYTSSTAQGGGGSFKNSKRIADWLL